MRRPSNGALLAVLCYAAKVDKVEGVPVRGLCRPDGGASSFFLPSSPDGGDSRNSRMVLAGEIRTGCALLVVFLVCTNQIKVSAKPQVKVTDVSLNLIAGDKKFLLEPPRPLVGWWARLLAGSRLLAAESPPCLCLTQLISPPQTFFFARFPKNVGEIVSRTTMRTNRSCQSIDHRRDSYRSCPLYILWYSPTNCLCCVFKLRPMKIPMYQPHRGVMLPEYGVCAANYR